MMKSFFQNTNKASTRLNFRLYTIHCISIKYFFQFLVIRRCSFREVKICTIVPFEVYRKRIVVRNCSFYFLSHPRMCYVFQMATARWRVPKLLKCPDSLNIFKHKYMRFTTLARRSYAAFLVYFNKFWADVSITNVRKLYRIVQFNGSEFLNYR